MRVISGSAKGRKLRPVPGDTTRPITDRVKEALFNILAGDVRGSRWLDLFAGTGSVGIEALSRGAEEAWFVDSSQAALDTVHANLEHTRLAGGARLMRRDALRFLSSAEPSPFDYVYVAPPQYRGTWVEVLELLDGRPGWLAGEGEVIVQIAPVEFRELELESLELFDERRYGSTLLCFYGLVEAKLE